MPPRDEEDYERKRQQIIDAALHVFAGKGFEKATNKDIAQAAHIGSPGLIYHYFKDKSDLFRQVIEQRAPLLRLLDHGAEELMPLPLEEGLALFASRLLVAFESRTTASMLKMMISEAARRPALAELFNKLGPGRGLALLNQYLAYHMDQGNLRRMDPGIASRCFMGPYIAYILTRELFIQPDSATLDSTTMVSAGVDLFLRGMRP